VVGNLSLRPSHFVTTEPSVYHRNPQHTPPLRHALAIIRRWPVRLVMPATVLIRKRQTRRTCLTFATIRGIRSRWLIFSYVSAGLVTSREAL
jgi:hypothetical protein